MDAHLKTLLGRLRGKNKNKNKNTILVSQIATEFFCRLF
jgi:hypothetical protein